MDSREVRKQPHGGPDERRDPNAGVRDCQRHPGHYHSLRSLDGSKGVSFHTFSLPENRFVHLLLKNIGKRTPEAEIQEKPEALHINAQGVMRSCTNKYKQTTDTKFMCEKISFGRFPHFLN
jgi:hypothetical protein